MGKDKEPLIVTIRCITYNHESFIRQCLEGFVMQKTNFCFEAIVHDDASTDGTASIILEYAKKYPDIIKPIIETENQYSKHDGSLSRIMNEHTHGKYVAICEGDDYWTDPYKLQKQVDFLEIHPECSLCFHNAVEHWEKGEKEDRNFVQNTVNREYTGVEILKNWIIPTASVIFRSEIIHTSLYKKMRSERRFLYGDTILFLTAAHYGCLYYLNDVMSVYRRHEGGAVFRDVNFSQRVKFIDHYKAIKEIFGKKYDKTCDKLISNVYFGLFIRVEFTKGFFYAIKLLCKSFSYSPKVFSRKFYSFLKNKK